MSEVTQAWLSAVVRFTPKFSTLAAAKRYVAEHGTRTVIAGDGVFYAATPDTAAALKAAGFREAV